MFCQHSFESFLALAHESSVLLVFAMRTVLLENLMIASSMIWAACKFGARIFLFTFLSFRAL